MPLDINSVRGVVAATMPGGAVAYSKVDSIAKIWDYLVSLGGHPEQLPNEVDGGISTAIVADSFGNLVGLIQPSGS